MKKNKMIALGVAAALMTTAAIGGTMAYFTDTDAATNVFTVGNVKIALHEANEAGATDDAYQAWLADQKLVPTTSAQKENTIDKIVTIENTGDVDAYLWAEVWIPSELDNENAALNSLHYNFSGDVKFKAVGTKEIDDVSYTGYIHYVEGATSAGETTPALMHQVYMDSKVTQCTEGHDNCMVLADGTTHYAGSWELVVNAVGIQADSFENIDAAMKAYYAENSQQ